MSWDYYGWRPYVTVAQRRANAERELGKLARKTGASVSPVILEGRTIASTFWGKAWCDNLEAYSDYANRLPRGRSYVRNGSVVDLQIAPGKITARVAGSSLYRIEIKIQPLAPSLWKSIQTECGGKIDSLIELLQGRLSSAVMQIVTRPERGLFPTPREIDLDCSCPDWADLCKHVAATLYGVGARLDQKPELLFLLRGVDPADLISRASAAETVRQSTRADGAPAIGEGELADVFGIELAPPSAPPAAPPRVDSPLEAPAAAPEAQPAVTAKPKPKKTRIAPRRMSAASRARIAAAARRRWAKHRQQQKQQDDRLSQREQPPRRRTLSAAARARLAEAVKARWAALKRAAPRKKKAASARNRDNPPG
ncbi:MAG TPA: SWIM zinc finger family protein [Candidatus Paceibacterota bacterium]|nr:SWIM zinc finger family protein [Candidatus Paceibacterota bacterium]